MGPITLKKQKQVYLRLCESIVSQQLSVKAADTIYDRFLAFYDNREPTPRQILDTPVERLRSAGLSNAKAGYRDVAKFELEKGMEPQKIARMTMKKSWII